MTTSTDNNASTVVRRVLSQNWDILYHVREIPWHFSGVGRADTPNPTAISNACRLHLFLIPPEGGLDLVTNEQGAFTFFSTYVLLPWPQTRKFPVLVADSPA